MIQFAKVLAALIVVISSCHCIKPPLHYLQVGGNPHTTELRWIIEKIQSGSWGQDVEAVADNLKVARMLALNASLKGVEFIRDDDTLGVGTFNGGGFYWLNNVLADFLAFSQPEQVLVPCHNAEVRTFMGIVDLEFGGLEAYEKLLDNPPDNIMFKYLQHYGTKHCRECLDSAISRLEASLKRLQPSTEEKLDTLVSMGEEYLLEMSEVGLVVRAEFLDLATGEFDAKNMLDALKNYIQKSQDGELLKQLESDNLLVSVITDTCNDVRLKMPFDMYNLARLLTPEAVNHVKLSKKLQKFNEYNRICIPFYKRSTKKDAQSNVSSNLVRSVELSKWNE